MKLFFLAYIIVTVNSFSIHPSKSVQLQSSTSTTNEAQEIKWSLEQDWILQDTVPRYTVVSRNERRTTFWNQLKHDTPAFEGFTEFDLEKRYQTLFHNNNQLFCAGPSPVVLSDWWFHEAKNRIGGIIPSNNSMIWFQLFRGGKLEHLHQHVEFNMLPTPGGFVEAQDGLIYELGPAQPVNRLPDTRLLNQNVRKIVLLVITLSSVMSGTLAFMIGQQMTPNSSTVLQNHPKPTKFFLQSTSSPDSSIAEQRALQELKLLREKRVFTSAVNDGDDYSRQKELLERIHRDEETLSKLQKEETRQEGEALGFY